MEGYKRITYENIRILREAVSKLVQIIREAKNNIRIFSGEGFYIYNSAEVLMAIEAKTKENPKFEIKVNIGPYLYGEAKIMGDKLIRINGLILLAKEGFIKLYSRKTRTNKFHFYIADDGETMLYHAEEYHSCMTPFSQRKAKEDLSAEDLKQICQEFDDQLKDSILCCRENPEGNFLILTDGELKLFINYANEKGINCDELGKEEIEEILKKLKEELKFPPYSCFFSFLPY